jgi:hypothetical protein
LSIFFEQFINQKTVLTDGFFYTKQKKRKRPASSSDAGPVEISANVYFSRLYGRANSGISDNQHREQNAVVSVLYN